jgi:hypothetical protein
MTTKAIVTTFVLLLALLAPLSAQDPQAAPSNQARFQERLEKMKERLALTPEQTEQVRPVIKEEMEQLKALREKHQGDQGRRGRLKMAREFRDIQSATDEKLRAILSKTQMDELKKIREETRQELRERRGK